MARMLAGSTSFRPPRYGTPRNPDRQTLGPAIGVRVAQRLGRPLMPHQQYIVDVAYELDENGEDLWYDEVDLTSTRQSGKTFVAIVKHIARATVIAHWFRDRQVSTYTAQTGKKARQKWDYEIVGSLDRSSSFREVRRSPKKPGEYSVRRTNGSEAVSFWNGSRIGVEAPAKAGTETAGHGDTLDDGTIDEALARVDDTQEQAMRPTMATRRSPQLWVCWTGGFKNSFYAWEKVRAGRHRCETGEHGRTAYFEWSAHEDEKIDDPATWYRANPALGLTIPESFIASQLEKARTGAVIDEESEGKGVAGFQRAYLNQWPEIPVIEDATSRALQVADWYVLIDEESRRVPGETLVLAFDVSPDRWSSIAACGTRPDGQCHSEVIKHAAGTEWVVPELVRLVARHRPTGLWFDGSGPALSLLPELQREGFQLAESKIAPGKNACEMHTISGRLLYAACGLLVDAVKHHQLRHIGQTEMANAIDGARRTKSGDMWRFSRVNSLADISPLMATAAAYWGYRQARPLNVAPAFATPAVQQGPGFDVFDRRAGGRLKI